MNKLEKLLNEINLYYIAEKDLYMCYGEIIVELNELLYFIKKNFDNRYYRLFENIKSPFGYWDHFSFKYENIMSMDFDKTKNFTLKNYRTLEDRLYNLSSRCDNQELNRVLERIIELLNYVKEIGVYIEHTTTNNTERY